ncbi:MAG: hypothetical protein U0X40_05565 [Ferruginibacter sp.]
MRTFLTIISYPKYYGVFGGLAVLVFRIILAFRRSFSFWKLLGSGKNEGFYGGINWRKWAILVVMKDRKSEKNEVEMEDRQIANSQLNTSFIYGKIIDSWLRFFKAECLTIELSPLSGHGQWNGKAPWGLLPDLSSNPGPVAVLTRARIRFGVIRRFRQQVPPLADKLKGRPGLVYTLGLGELPFLFQATFSIWQTAGAMEAFAYKSAEHQQVMDEARRHNWFSEALFVRFRVVNHCSSPGNNDPLTGNL